MTESLRIAMLGSRGVPASYGGIEHHVEELGRRLVERGHRVTVFCEQDYVTEGLTGDGIRPMSEFLGMERVVIPTTATKHLEAIVHSARSTRRVFGAGFDIVHYHAVGPGVFSFVPRWMTRAKVVQTIHGLDAERSKWGRAARAMLQTATWLSARVPDSTVVVSRSLETHYAHRYGCRTLYVPNGVTALPAAAPGPLLTRLAVEPGRYVLFVGRLVPEKRPDLLVRAFREVQGPWKLVLAGGASYTDDYVERLAEMCSGDGRVTMAGYVYGRERDELYSNAGVFVLPSALEGLPLTLLEACAAGLPVIASDIDPHVEVLGSSLAGGRLFPEGNQSELARILQASLDGLEEERCGAVDVRRKVLQHYDWEHAVDLLEDEYRRLTRSL